MSDPQLWPGPDNTTRSNVSASTSAVEIAPSADQRFAVIIRNVSNRPLYIALGDTPEVTIANASIEIPAGETRAVSTFPGEIRGIWATGAQDHAVVTLVLPL